MSEKHAVDIVGVKRPRPSSITSAISPQTPLPSVRKSAMNSSSCESSVGCSTQSNKSSTPGTPPLIGGVQGNGRIDKWSSLLSNVLMQGRAREEETHIHMLAQRIAVAIPGDRSIAADNFRVLLVNLKDVKNGQLRNDTIEGRLPVEVLVRMTERELLNPEERRNQEAEFLERSKDTDLTEIRKATASKSTLFTCPSCKEKNCTWTQKQTRSGDEPMTIFCTCNICGHKWKRY